MDSNTTSTSATVIAARHDYTEMVSLSARPQVTFATPWWNDPVHGDRTFPYLVVSYGNTVNLQGYMFTNTTAVYVSASPGVYTNTLSAVSAFNLFSNASPLTGRDLLSQFPAFSGFKLDSTDWHVVNDYTMTVDIAASQATGYIDLIIANVAGYSLLSTDLSGGGIVVRT
jgi:hypothetical protein